MTRMTRQLFCLLLGLSLGLMAMNADEARELCRDAEKCFEQGNELSATNHEAAVAAWRMAAARMERAVREGHLANGGIYYNLGNVYFRLGDMGRAILNYRRAQRFEPNDAKLKRNLSYALRNCQDSVQEQEGRKVLKTLFFWHYDFSLALRERLFILCLCLACVLGMFRLRVRQTGLGIAALGSLLLALVLAASVAVSDYAMHHQRPGVILAAEIVGRTGNGENYEKSFKDPLHAGTEFQLVELRGNWMEISLADGKSCWIPCDSSELL